MKIMAGIISLISLFLLVLNWNTPLAAAWAVALAGWIPHVLNADTQRKDHGHQA